MLKDSRLERIEAQIRRDFPSLPEYCTFVSYIQEPTWARVGAIDVQIPMTAVLAIIVTNYRHRDSVRIFQTGEVLSRWQQREHLTRHDSDIRVDPAYRALKAMVPEILEWDANLRAMN